MSAQTVAALAAAPNSIPFASFIATDVAASTATEAATESTGDNIILFSRPRRLTVTESMTNLRDAAQEWEKTAYRTANEKLYQILAQCYEFEHGFNRKDTESLNDFCKQHGVAFNANTLLMAKIVKCVFDADRRRVSTYVLALRSAKQHGVKPAGLAQWLKDQGGVQEIALKRSPNYKTTLERAEAARETVFTQPVLATVDGGKLMETYDRSLGEEVLLVASYNDDNTFSVRQLIQKSGPLNAALSSVFKQAAATAAQTEATAQAQTAQEVQDAAINQVSEGLRNGGAV